MSKTEVSGKQIKDGSIELVDLSTSVANDISTLKSDVASLQTDVASVQSGSVSSSYVDSAVATVASSLSNVQTDVSALQSSVAAKASSASVSAIDTRLSNLEADPTTKTYVDEQVSGLVNSAPATLNTLKELADALGDDANFATTVSGQIGAVAADVSALDARVTSAEGDISSLQSSAFSGSYNDLSNKPSLFSGSYADLSNKPALATVATSGAYSDLTGKPSLATVATSGSYTDLINKPSLFSGSYTDLSNKPSLFSGSYTDLTNKPTLFDGAYSSLTGAPSLATVATSGSYNDLTNKPSIPSLTGYATESYVTSAISGKADSSSLAAVATSGSYTDLINKPSLFSGSYTDLTNKPSLFSGSYTDLSNKPTLFDGAYSSLTGAPSLAAVATSGAYSDLTGKPSLFSGAYSDLTGKPSLATVATSGSYADLSNKPTLGSFTTLTTPASGQFLKYNGTAWVNSAVAYSDVTGTPSLATVATSGSYADLTNKPTIPSLTGYATETYVDNKVSALVASAPAALDTLNELATALGNDANFSTTMTNALAAKASTASLATVATSGSYADLSNKPTLGSFTTLTTPASGQFLKYNGTAWVNSAVAYSDVTGTPSLATVATSGSYADLSNKPTLGSFTTLTTPTSGQFLKYNGSAWVNSAVAYTDVTGTPSLATVATSGSYADLSNKPTIPGTSDGNALGATTITTTAAATKALVVKGAASQSASLFEAQNSSGTAFVKIDSAGSGIFAGGGWNTHPIQITGSIDNNPVPGTTGVYAGTSGGYAWLRMFGSNTGIIDFGAVNGNLYNSRILGYGTGMLFYSGYNTLTMAFGNHGYSGYPGTLHVLSVGASTKGIVARAAASQTANILEAQDNSGTQIFAVTPSDVQTAFNGITSKETNAAVTTSDATTTTLYSLALADNTSYTFDVSVVGRLNTTTAKGLYGKARFTVYRNNAGNATLAADFNGVLKELDTYGSSGYDFSVSVSSTSIYIKVTGAASESVKWAANVRYVSVS